MSIKDDLLSYIVDASKPNANPQNPHGYCYIEAGHEATATELHNEELIQALVTSRAQDGSFPVRPTDAAIAWATAAKVTEPAPQLGGTGFTAGQPANAPQMQTLPPDAKPVSRAQGIGPDRPVLLETDVPIPDKKAFGPRTDGEDKVSKYGFAHMPINASFFLPETGTNPDKPIHRVFSSVVSQANKKLHPMNFVIREWTQQDGTKGARIWRTEDMQGERPTRTRKVTQPAQPAPQQHAAQGWTQPAQPAPGQNAGFPSFPGGHPAPGNPGFGNAPQGGFAAPSQPAPAGWGGAPAFGEGDLPPFG